MNSYFYLQKVLPSQIFHTLSQHYSIYQVLQPETNPHLPFHST